MITEFGQSHHLVNVQLDPPLTQSNYISIMQVCVVSPRYRMWQRYVYTTVEDLLLLLSTHFLDPCLLGESDHTASGPPASLSFHLASSSIIPAGSVHKSRGANVVRM